jgi:predicted permease
MLENLLFSLERIAPFFLLIALGLMLGKFKWVQKQFFVEANSFVYQIALPISLFCSIASPEAGAIVPSFVAYMFAATLLSFFFVWGITELVFKDKSIVGTLVQGGFRGNTALLGIPLATAVAGPSGAQKAAMGVLAVVPVYNVFSVFILMLRGKEKAKPNWASIGKGILHNRLILGIVLALPFALLKIRIPDFLFRTANLVGQTATPLGLLSIGGLFQLSDATARLRPALYASSFKLLIVPGLLDFFAYQMGFRGEELLVMFLLFAAPTAISSYSMASALRGDAPLASNIVIITTILSGFIFAAGIYIMRTVGII